MKAKPGRPADPTAFKREEAGTYRSGDGRFSIEQASGRWLVVDAEQHDDLGLPLVRGPFDTLARAREAASSARSGPAPTSGLVGRASSRVRPRATRRERAAPSPALARPPTPPKAPKPPAIEVRRYRSGDGDALRELWSAVGFRSVGDDDESLDRMAERNPGLLLVGTEDDRIVASALGAWDGRRGWIYHVGTAADHRRTGLGSRLIHEVERKLRQLGCPRVNVIVRDEHPEAPAFWEALGYVAARTRQFGKEL